MASRTTTRSNLRAVRADEAPPKKTTRRKQKSVSEAASGGDHRELLVAMRERIAKAVSDLSCPARDLAALTRRLQEIAKEIEAIDRQRKQEADDDDEDIDDTFDASAL